MQSTTPIAKATYSISETMAATGLGRTTINELIKTERLRTIKVGRRRLVPVAALADFLDSLSGAA